jgi:pimeloyl-ACP methyl ester carboxylesterase
MFRKLLKIVAVLAVLLVIAFVAMVVWAWKNPLALYETMTRSALQKSGLERMSMPVGEGELVWFEGGEGRELILLHGAGDQAGAWAAVVPTLIKKYRVVVLDMPGHGDSDPGEGPLKLTTVVDGVAAFLESGEAKEPAILIGHSMGAWVSMRVATRLPDRVARVVLVNGGPLRFDTGKLTLTPRDREEARRLMEALRDPSSDPIPNFVLDDIVQHAADGPIGRLASDIADMESHLMDERLHEFLIPVDVMWGESDLLIPVEYAKRVAEQLPEATLTLVPECGHHPANECPVEFSRLLRKVLEGGS